MSTTIAVASPASIEAIEARIAPLRARLTAHPLYSHIRSPRDLQIFMESHVFAVWDFMSLLKALQAQLTCVSVPWVPTSFPASRRFINEIVLGEESDEFQGQPISHFELYLAAMQQAGANTSPIQSLLGGLSASPSSASHELSIAAALAAVDAPSPARSFVGATFSIIHSGSIAAMAAAFTFGREDVIPDIFRELVRDLSTQNAGTLDTFIWYLERHIEIDGEDHGPLSLRMVADLCGSDESLWQQASDAAVFAIEARLALWDGILTEIQTPKATQPA